MTELPNNEYIEDEEFNGLRLEDGELTDRLFEDCVFTSCRFSDLDLRGTAFRGCRFGDCELSLLKVAGAAFASCDFEDCRLQGINFADCAPHQVYLNMSGCEIRHCFFAEGDLKNTQLS